MKKAILFLISVTMIIGMSGCTKYKNEIFTSNKADFTAVVEFARSYYETHKSEGSDHITLTFDDGVLHSLTEETAGVINDTVVDDIPDDISASLSIISSKFDFLWVNDTYVIFWEDETKYYGLLWSESAKKAISSLKEWYNELDQRKLEANWYEIGVLYGI